MVYTGALCFILRRFRRRENWSGVLEIAVSLKLLVFRYKISAIFSRLFHRISPCCNHCIKPNGKSPYNRGAEIAKKNFCVKGPLVKVGALLVMILLSEAKD